MRNNSLSLLSIMRFTSLTLFFVLLMMRSDLITFVSAILAPDEYIHFNDPGCPGVGAQPCRHYRECTYHRKRGDLFTFNGALKSRDAPERENSDLNLRDALSPSLALNYTMRELGVNRKRSGRSTQCGVLSSITNNDVSDWFGTFLPG